MGLRCHGVEARQEAQEKVEHQTEDGVSHSGSCQRLLAQMAHHYLQTTQKLLSVCAQAHRCTWPHCLCEARASLRKPSALARVESLATVRFPKAGSANRHPTCKRCVDWHMHFSSTLTAGQVPAEACEEHASLKPGSLCLLGYDRCWQRLGLDSRLWRAHEDVCSVRISLSYTWSLHCNLCQLTETESSLPHSIWLLNTRTTLVRADFAP